MDITFSNPVYVLFVVVNSLLPLVLIYFYLKLVYATLITRKSIDIPGRSWVRILSQILISLPLGVLGFGAYFLFMQLTSASYKLGCTSGPGMGECFEHGIYLALSVTLSLGLMIVGSVLYRYATTKP